MAGAQFSPTGKYCRFASRQCRGNGGMLRLNIQQVIDFKHIYGFPAMA
jgi:hypothetical protein